MSTSLKARKVLKLTANIFATMLLILALVVSVLVIKSKLDGGSPNFAGYRLYVVLTGSMVPVFDPGSMVVVKELDTKKIAVGDIITFKEPGDSKKTVTHRVVEINNKKGNLEFTTKGDANNANDRDQVNAGNVIGKEMFSVPYAGYFLDFAKTRKGRIYLLTLPGVLFIIYELRNLYKLLGQYEDEQKQKLNIQANVLNEMVQVQEEIKSEPGQVEI